MASGVALARRVWASLSLVREVIEQALTRRANAPTLAIESSLFVSGKRIC